VSYNLPFFDFDVCACALTPDTDWAPFFMPTSLQTGATSTCSTADGGNEYLFDCDRFGTFKVHGRARVKEPCLRLREIAPGLAQQFKVVDRAAK